MRFTVPKFILTLLVSFTLFGITSGVNATDDGRLAMFYAKISPDGDSIAFSWVGDIWIADVDTGHCTRLTDHVAHDWKPVWFPDSTKIAFASKRDGNDDIYSVPISGGVPTRHTWHGNYDVPLDISPDGQTMLLRSYRGRWASNLFEVDLDGGLPRPVTNDTMSHRDGRYSSDGNTILGVRGGQGWTRRDYNGSGSTGILLMDRDGGNMRWIENSYDGIDYWPNYGPGDENIYFVSDRDGNENVYRISSTGGTPEQLTQFEDRPVLFMSVAETGRIAFIQDFKLWYLDAGRSPRQIDLDCMSEAKHSQEVRLNISGNVSEVEVSPLSNYLAVIARGEIYLTPFNDPNGPEELGDDRFGESIRITDTSSRESDIVWHPDGDRLAFVSDKDGNREIYEIDLRTFEWTRLTNSPDEEYFPNYSPDGNQLGYYRANDKLILLNLETMEERVVLDQVLITSPWPPNYQWSPDSKWIAFTHEDLVGWPEVFVLNVEGDAEYNDPVNITIHHDADYFRGWTEDGESLYFLSARDQAYGLNPWGSWSLGYTLYSLPLKPIVPARSDFIILPDEPEEDPEESSQEGEDEESEEGDELSEEEDSEEEETLVEFDFHRIHERARSLSPTRTGGWRAALSPDGTTFVYDASPMGVTALWSIPFEGGTATHITNVPAGLDDIEWVADGSGVVYLTGGWVYFWDKGSVSNVPVHGRLTIDLAAERNQMIDETGRILRNHYYDPDMHNTPWDQNVDYYKPLVEDAVVREDFTLLMSMLFGELDSSHLGCWGGSSIEGTGNSPAYLGLKFNAFTEGPGLEVLKVYDRGPADYTETTIEAGEWVLEINGEPVSTSSNFWKLLDDSSSRTTTLTVAAGQYSDETRDVELAPVPWVGAGALKLSWNEILYFDWVDGNQSVVEEGSGGRIGYEHIISMSGGPLERFTRQLFSENFEKEALIIDVRFNGGGNTHEQLLDILSRPQLGWQQGREEEMLAQPPHRWDRPIVLLINERCFSDSEIFPAGFRELGLGTIMGVTTWGGVIGTWNLTLVDGVTTIRAPRNGWFTVDGENMENLGIEPDIYVEQDMNHLNNGIDDQLLAAIEYLLDEIED